MKNHVITKDIPCYEGRYQAISNGDIISLHGNKPRTLKQHLNGRGYPHLVLRKNGTSKTYNTHKLIALCFLGQCPKGYQVNHKDGNKLNNFLSNLEYTSPRENSNLYHDTQTYSSKYRGIIWCKTHKKWLSRIVINKKRHHLGYFNLEIDAANAYQNALKNLRIFK